MQTTSLQTTSRALSSIPCLVVALVSGLAAGVCSAAEPDRPAGGELVTRWGRTVTADNAWPEYPRPQQVRSRWLNLNGQWNYALQPRTETSLRPERFDGQILVPFPVESHLSGVRRSVGADQRVLYHRRFELPADWHDQHVLLHFGAVDWETRVVVNGVEIGTHRGGYDPFVFDITAALRAQPEQTTHELVVIVWDPSDAGPQPRGKQVSRPEGIWYTPVTGIWQTVWLEPVPASHLLALRLAPQYDAAQLLVDAPVANPRAGQIVRLTVPGTTWRAEAPAGRRLRLDTPGFDAWSTTNPRLYDLVVELLDGETVVDSCQGYFGMRKISVGTDRWGIRRLWLNNEPLFQFGPLDQGYWPDGLYTPPSDEALRFDLEQIQALGFNMVRKHVKVEPARWYTHCDRMGLLVWQDMPSGDVNARWPADGSEDTRTPAAAAGYETELHALLDTHHNHPSIVAWVPFNEGWGQFDTERFSAAVKARDPSRLVIAASGGNDFGTGDIRDIHFYPQPEFPPAEPHRAAVLGEYGGLGLPLVGHTWLSEKNWGYRQFKTREELQETYLKYIAALRPMVESHLAAAIYTQITDVEIEVNGLFTYDREILKLDPRQVAAAHRALLAPVPPLRPLQAAQASTLAWWRFEEGEPGELVPHDRSNRPGVAVRDVSGHRNHLYAYAAGNAPRHSRSVPAPRLPGLALDNQGSLDDERLEAGVTRDLYTDPGRSATHMDALNTFPLTHFTLELSVRMPKSRAAAPETWLGKDGRPTSHPEAPLQFGVNAEGHAELVLLDRGGAIRRVTSREPLPADRWLHLVAIADGGTLRLFLHDGGQYRLQSETPLPGGLILADGTWTVGRGFHDGRLGRDARALLDEIRISTRPLPLEWLLWSPPPADAPK